MFQSTSAALAGGVTALLLTAGCAGPSTPLAPSSTPRATAPTGSFSVVRPSVIHATEELPATPGTTPAPGTDPTIPALGVSTPCTPAPASTSQGGGTAADSAAPAAPVIPGISYYAVRRGGVRALEEAAAVPCATVQITIAGAVGTGAFTPNPSAAQVGDQIVWMNTDLRPHRIVIDDGTLTGTAIGDIPPGGSSLPFTLTTPTANYHCEFHPSMVGTINAPLPTSAAATPASESTDTSGAGAPDSGGGYYSAYRVK